MRRQIPQNYVVLIQNLPKVINLRSEVNTLIQPISAGVRAIVPVPSRSNVLTRLHEQLSGLKNTLKATQIYVEDLRANKIYN